MKLILSIFLIILTQWSSAIERSKFSVFFQQEGVDVCVAVPLNNINYNTDKGRLVLHQITPDGEKEIPCQLETGHTARLWFIYKGEIKKGTKADFVLSQDESKNSSPSDLNLKRDYRNLQLSYQEKPILSYRYSLSDVPEGVDPIYRRSGYIHPLRSPGGEILTRIQPEDHYHHYGIWGPWTKTHIGERQVDFWNLKEGQGTVQFAGFLSEEEGAVYTGFKALQQHIDFGAKGRDQIAMNEILDIRAWNLGENIWMIDYTTTLNSPLEDGIMLDAYRYGGGIGFRATQKWHKDNCTVLTSDNKTRLDADGSYAKWCVVEGESNTSEGRSGILFMSHPSNRMHPEPMRVWPEDANRGRGDMYFEFVPIRHDDWKLDQKNSYTLKYRMIIFDGDMNEVNAEKYWKSFSNQPVIEIKK